MPCKLFLNCAYILGAGAVLWLFARFVLPVALPFLLGAYLALAAEPAVRLLQSRLRLPRWVATALSVTAVCLLSLGALTLVLGLLTRQLYRLQNLLPQLEEAIRQGLSLLRQWLQTIPGGIGEKLAQLGTSENADLTHSILGSLPKILAAAAEKLSSGLFGTVTGLISGYMISLRLPVFRAFLRSKLPENWQTKYLPALRQTRRGLGGWLLAEAKLAGVAFVLLLLGFWVLSVPNGPMLAALITLVDIFPVLGVGTALIPWSLVCLLQGNPALGVGLLVLYGIIWLLRSVLEPKLLGKGLGLDPLLTLVTIYGGWRFFGIGGMLLAPLFTMAGMHLYKALRQ